MGSSRSNPVMTTPGCGRPGAAAVPFTVLAAVLIACPLLNAVTGCRELELDEETVIKAFQEIHHRIYEVYRIEEPGAVFDLLSQSLEGTELEKQVLEYLKCRKVQDRFQTEITILDVIYTDVRFEGVEDGVVRLYCKWVVIGKIRHPTHIHRKNNLNEALYRMRYGPDGPRIIGYDQIANQGVEVTPR